MINTIHLKVRQSGRLDAWYKIIAEVLRAGDVVDIAGCNENRVKQHALELKKRYQINVVFEPVYTKTMMRAIYDLDDPSPEPGIIGFDFGQKKFWGYKLRIAI